MGIFTGFVFALMIYMVINPQKINAQDIVLYEIEKGEQFRDIPTIIEDKFGDCDCLACWRVAELQDIGIAARPYIKWRREGDRWIYHAVVWLPNGKIEDPSMALGMGGGKVVRRPIYVQP